MRAKYSGKDQQTFEVRIRYGLGLGKDGGHLRGRYKVLAKDEQAKEAKRMRMSAIAQALAACGLHADVDAVLDEVGMAVSESVLLALENKVRGLCAETQERAQAASAETPASAMRTFDQVADLLFAEQRGKGNAVRTIDQDRQRLRVLQPKLGSTLVDQVTHALATEAMALVGPEVDVCRNLYEGLIFRVLKHAVKLDLIASIPLRPGFVSLQLPPKRLFQYLYVDEESALISFKPTPLWRRLGYGLMSREGVRPGLLEQFYWSDRVRPNQKVSSIDIESGLLTHRHKQKKTRRWPVCGRVLRVLRAWRKVNPDDRVLPEWIANNIARDIRADLIAADQKRLALHRTTALERMLGAKDAGRATFITLARRAGAPKEWITDRTGHESDEMEERYNRMARESRDTVRSWLQPLDEALGSELGLAPSAERYVVPWLQGLDSAALPTVHAPWPSPELGHVLGQLLEMAKQNNTSVPGLITRAGSSYGEAQSLNARNQATSHTSEYTTGPSGPVDLGVVGQAPGSSGPRSTDATPKKAKSKAIGASAARKKLVRASDAGPTPPTDVVKGDPLVAPLDAQLASLRASARVALEEDDFAMVAALGALIDKRVQALAAATPPNVTSIDAARKRRDEGSGGK
jgi:integrase